MRWLITGGAGFIGSNLIARLRSAGGDGDQIIVLDDFATTSRQTLCDAGPLAGAEMIEPERVGRSFRAGLGVVVGDIRNADLLRRVAEGADALVHLAANTGVGLSVSDPRTDSEINVTGTLNALEAARSAGVARFVFASSGAPAGLCVSPITEAVAPRPASPYGASKLAGEGYCSAYANAFGLHTVALRFSNVYGPLSRNKGSAVATFLRHALEGRPITINGDGSQTRDFIYVDDLVQAILLAARGDCPAGEVFQIATGIETSVNAVLGRIRGALARRGVGPIETIHAGRGPEDVLRNFADPSKAREVLGWRPETPFEVGIERTADWFLRAYSPSTAKQSRAERLRQSSQTDVNHNPLISLNSFRVGL